MISTRKYNSTWDEFPTFFRLLDDSAIREAFRRADDLWDMARGLEVVGPFKWFVVRVGPKGDREWPARVFILFNLEEILDFRIPKGVELRGIDLVSGARIDLGGTTGMCIVRVWRRKQVHPNGLTHLLETADGEMIPVPDGDPCGMDVADFDVVLSLPAPVAFEESRHGNVR
jgi:hypothetical protein